MGRRIVGLSEKREKEGLAWSDAQVLSILSEVARHSRRGFVCEVRNNVSTTGSRNLSHPFVPSLIHTC